MPATRIISKEIQEQDLNQLKSIFGSSNWAASPVIQEEKLAEERQIETVLPSEQPEQAKVRESEMPEKQIQTVADSPKQVTDTTVGIRMTTQKKREIKAFFIQKGTTLSQGIVDAYNLLKSLDAEGIITYKDGQLIRK